MSAEQEKQGGRGNPTHNWALWALSVSMAISGFFLKGALTDIQSTQQKQGEQLQQVSSDVRVISARVDYALIEQMKDMKARIERLEQAVKTP